MIVENFPGSFEQPKYKNEAIQCCHFWLSITEKYLRDCTKQNQSFGEYKDTIFSVQIVFAILSLLVS